MSQAEWAEATARRILAKALPRRWAHTQGVAAAARTLAPVLGRDGDLLTAAAWLHDIGYAPGVASTGFHPLDGARHLRDAEGASGTLCRLVAYHSCAINEAAERGLARDLTAEFRPARRDLADALTYCDMTTSPDGDRMPIAQRLDDIRARYAPGGTGQPRDHALGAGTDQRGSASPAPEGRFRACARIASPGPGSGRLLADVGLVAVLGVVPDA